ncbi:MAG: HNH endonuclease [Verrucomicrobia bacterium]|nr:HNH endonuclease [Verrucomicrobiota bacterium]
MIRDAYVAYAQAKNVGGSGKASSYIKALDLLCKMIKKNPRGFSDCENIWAQTSIERLESLYSFVCEEKRRGEGSLWNYKDLPKSYLLSGYCSAALRDYQAFLVEHLHEQLLLTVFEQHSGDEGDVVAKLSKELDYPLFLIDDLPAKQGKEMVRSVKTRTNQRAFQSIVQRNYRGLCCITGLEVQEVNRASHIIGWAENEETRMDPRNGLYLSATYDAAFDRHLLSIDDDYRIILSRDLKDRYTSDVYSNVFGSREGAKIQLPQAFLPKVEYLEFHRSKGGF